ncbi:hypothetical protein BC828DRAFT_373974 [Blastocladiella britannica]|nr:hypothetical protein BC828DRAFT_373974 [Blastocladiella britannica]
MLSFATTCHFEEEVICAVLRHFGVDPLAWVWDRIADAPMSVKEEFDIADPSQADVRQSQAAMAFWLKVQSARGIKTIKDAERSLRQCYVEYQPSDGHDHYEAFYTDVIEAPDDDMGDLGPWDDDDYDDDYFDEHLGYHDHAGDFTSDMYD